MGRAIIIIVIILEQSASVELNERKYAETENKSLGGLTE